MSSARRRPADVFLQSFLGRPTALDFAVTAPQRLEALGGGGDSAAEAYTAFKRRHLATADVCAAQQVVFLLVIETTGAWAPEAAKALDYISRAVVVGMAGPPSCKRRAPWSGAGVLGLLCGGELKSWAIGVRRLVFLLSCAGEGLNALSPSWLLQPPGLAGASGLVVASSRGCLVCLVSAS